MVTNPRDYLTDARWEELRQLSRLPDDARQRVATVIRFLREKPSSQNRRERSFLKSRAAVKRAIEKGFPKALQLLNELIDQRVDRFMIRPLEPRPRGASGVYVTKTELERVRAALKEYSEMLSRVWPRLRVSRGRKRGPLSEAIRELHNLAVVFTGSAMNSAKPKRKRTNADWVRFVQEILKIADFKHKGKDIQPSTIAKEIKEANPTRFRSHRNSRQ